MHTFFVETQQRSQFVDITEAVRQALLRSGVQTGVGVICSLHTTAAITINEAYDPNVVHDLLLYLDRTVPKDYPGFRHAEGNSDAHIKAALVGQSALVLVDQGELVLGRWQGIFFCEFDGPRQRTVAVQWLAEDSPPLV
jgi:secondary thiamine-phosphate synthase enzyme